MLTFRSFLIVFGIEKHLIFLGDSFLKIFRETDKRLALYGHICLFSEFVPKLSNLLTFCIWPENGQKNLCCSKVVKASLEFSFDPYETSLRQKVSSTGLKEDKTFLTWFASKHPNLDFEKICSKMSKKWFNFNFW